MLKKILAAAALGSVAMSAMAAPSEYVIESTHTYPSFQVPHMGISYWRGKFNKTTGNIVLDKEAGTGKVDITVDVSSIDFGNDALNEHAQTADFFDVAKYPTAHYTGDLVFAHGVPTAVNGSLTMHGVTRPLKLTINSFKCMQNPFFKKEDCGADASAEFDRKDFGLNAYADGPLGDTKLSIQVEALKKD